MIDKSKRKGPVLSRNRILLISTALVIVALSFLPFYEGTKSYPVAVVDGNSMFPNLHNGDLVVFGAPAGPISNGSIIVFAQGGSPVSAWDSWVKPIVIHRIIGIGREPSGMTFYQTKGDNNGAPDPFVTDSDSVLGVPVMVIPYAGLPLLFLKTAYGMVALTALVTVFFVSGVETRLLDGEEKKRLLAVFARHSLNGELSPKDLERIKLAIEYYEDISVEELKDPTLISAVDWLRKGGLKQHWKERRTLCPVCESYAFTIESGDNSFLVCPDCRAGRPSRL